MAVKITNYDELNRVWNQSDSVKAVADHFGCSIHGVWSARRRAGQVFPQMQWKSHRQPMPEEIFHSKPCSEPTSASIGTVEKVEVLRQRAERGEDLFHPMDKSEFSGVDTLLVQY